MNGTRRLAWALAAGAVAAIILGAALGAMGPEPERAQARVLGESRSEGTLETAFRVRDTEYVAIGPSSKNVIEFHSGPDGRHAVIALRWTHNTELGGLLAPRDGVVDGDFDAAEYVAYTTGPSPLHVVAPIEPDTWYTWTVYPIRDEIIKHLVFETRLQVFGADPEGFLLFVPEVGAASAVASAAAGAALAAGTSLVLARAFWLFYCRLKPGALLENANRGRLLAVARTRPGLSLREAAREAGVSKTTAEYHLRMLARFGFLLLTREARDARVVRVFPLHEDPRFAQDPRARALTIALSHEPCRRLAKAFLDRALEAPEDASMSLADAVRITGVPKPTAFRHLRALARAGVLEIHGETPRARQYFLTPEGRHRLQAVPFPLERPPPAESPGEPAPSGAT